MLSYIVRIIILMSIPSIAWGTYKSAGILPYAYDNNGVGYFLVGGEMRSIMMRAVRHQHLVWSDFGGKQELQDHNDPRNTAIRECDEETRFVFDAQSLDLQHKIVCDEYVMYLAQVPFIPVAQITSRPFEKNTEKTAYAWVPIKELMVTITQGYRKYKNMRLHGRFIRSLQKPIMNIVEHHLINKHGKRRATNKHEIKN